MLKRLQNRLRIFLIVIFMAVVSLILCFSFWNTWQARQIADITYVQRMASLIIYQLEADPARPDELLSNYEREMHVYSILKDSAGNILHQSDPDTLTDLDTLGKLRRKALKFNLRQIKQIVFLSPNREDMEKSPGRTMTAIMLSRQVSAQNQEIGIHWFCFMSSRP